MHIQTCRHLYYDLHLVSLGCQHVFYYCTNTLTCPCLLPCGFVFKQRRWCESLIFTPCSFVCHSTWRQEIETVLHKKKKKKSNALSYTVGFPFTDEGWNILEVFLWFFFFLFFFLSLWLSSAQFLIEVKNSMSSIVPPDWVKISRWVVVFTATQHIHSP